MVCEGSIPVKDGGIYCKIAGKPVLDILKETATTQTCRRFLYIDVYQPRVGCDWRIVTQRHIDWHRRLETGWLDFGKSIVVVRPHIPGSVGSPLQGSSILNLPRNLLLIRRYRVTLRKDGSVLRIGQRLLRINRLRRTGVGGRLVRHWIQDRLAMRDWPCCSRCVRMRRSTVVHIRWGRQV